MPDSLFAQTLSKSSLVYLLWYIKHKKVAKKMQITELKTASLQYTALIICNMLIMQFHSNIIQHINIDIPLNMK